jgi:hypothetical protein
VLLAAPACRLRTTYDGGATAACMAEATADAGAGDMSGVQTRCVACCQKRGLSSVEPGYCECGKLGLDALLK